MKRTRTSELHKVNIKVSYLFYVFESIFKQIIGYWGNTTAYFHLDFSGANPRTFVVI